MVSKYRINNTFDNTEINLRTCAMMHVWLLTKQKRPFASREVLGKFRYCRRENLTRHNYTTNYACKNLNSVCQLDFMLTCNVCNVAKIIRMIAMTIGIKERPIRGSLNSNFAIKQLSRAACLIACLFATLCNVTKTTNFLKFYLAVLSCKYFLACRNEAYQRIK